MIEKLAAWLDDRLGTSAPLAKALRKVFPDHWSFMLGEIALYCFVVLVATGIFLTAFFEGSSRPVIYDGSFAPLDGSAMSAAFASVLRLSFDVRAGLVFRQVHHWAALLFLAAIVVHVSRIFFTGAFRRPREINWMIGVTMLTLALLAGFTGYSLPDDLLSGTGLRIAYSIALSVPFVGTWAAQSLTGGGLGAAAMLPRLEIAHVLLLPALVATAIACHLAIVWRQHHTQFPGNGRTERNVVGVRLWPTFALRSVALGACVAGVLGLLGGIVQINPVWLFGPYVAWKAASPAQPDWYMGWLEGLLRLWPPWRFAAFGHAVGEPFLPAVALPVLLFGVLFCWPFIERAFTKDRRPHELLDRAREAPWRTAIGVGALALALVLTAAGGNDVLGTFFGVPVETINVGLDILVVALPLAAGAVAYSICNELRARGEDGQTQTVALTRTSSGGYAHEPAAPVEPKIEA